jgi:RNA polymerase sigma-70 factor (ECF subfamily)
MVERARGGDADAFDELVTLDADRCLGIAFRITRDLRLAEDAVQEALVLVWRDLPNLRDVERYEMWLHRLVVNACYTELRRRRRWTDRIAMLPVERADGADPYRSADERDALERAFARLPADRRAMFVLRHYAGLSLAEIAEVVGLPVGTVKSRLHYATDTLQAALAADARLERSEARS